MKIKMLSEMAETRRQRREERIKELQQEAQLRFEEAYNRPDANRFRDVVDELDVIRRQMLRAVVARLTGDGIPTREELRQRTQQLTVAKQDALRELGYPINHLDVMWDCPKCQNTGKLPDQNMLDGERVVPGGKCDCFIREEIEDLFLVSGMKGPMREWTFEHLNPEVYPQEHRPKMMQLANECQTFSQDLLDGKTVESMVLLGDVGRGKTFLICCVANMMLQGGKSVAYLKENELMRLARKKKFDDGDEEGKILNKLLEADLLMIDDLGTEIKESFDGAHVTSFVKQTVLEVLETRISSNKPYMITTNLTADDISEIYGERVGSRVFGYCKLKEVPGADLRILMREREFRGQLNQLVGSLGFKEDWTFENLDDTLYRGTNHSQMTKLVTTCEKWAELAASSGNPENRFAFVLSGGPGTGKTFLACSIANEVLRGKRDVAYLHALDVRRLEKADAEFLDTIYKADLFMLDGLGEEKPTPFAVQTINRVLAMRIENRKPMLITTAMPKHELIATYGERMDSLLKSPEMLWKTAVGEDINALLRERNDR